MRFRLHVFDSFSRDNYYHNHGSLMLEIYNVIKLAIKKAFKVEFSDFNIEISPDLQGDVSSSVALKLSNIVEQNPQEIALKIIDNIDSQLVERVFEKNGFINLVLSEHYISSSINRMVHSENLSINKKYQNKKIQVEFISANPTGPLHIGNARGGPLGETLANIFEATGAQVTREYYINDIGGQIDRFSESILYLLAPKFNLLREKPEETYTGENVENLAQQIYQEVKPLFKGEFDRPFIELIRSKIIELNISQIKKTVVKLGIIFDNFTYQSEINLTTSDVLKKLQASGATAKKGGALWFAKDINDKESVLVKSDGSNTYYADDINYHYQKFAKKKFDLVIDIWGANHHGHVTRISDALESLNIDPSRLKIILYQYVRLKNGDQIEKMAKRKGTYISADLLLEKIPADVFKFFMLMRSANTHLDFDFSKAVDSSLQNPIYYTYYAIARVNSINNKSTIDSQSQELFLGSKIAKEIGVKLLAYPALIDEVSNDFAVQKLTSYSFELAKLLHHFYEKERIICDHEEREKLNLINAVRTVLVYNLNLMGIKAPDKLIKLTDK